MKIIEVSSGLGITVESKGTYYKPTIEIRAEIGEEDKGKPISEVVKKIQSICEEQLERQLKELI